ncbi:hypothetical protein GP486_007435 [Trichoglossum hirsutum]|uniref:MOSC domain-containing protein n=1 Tax=Trichoglossum hirsutum TaxID=265104 RepID=A0A9P8IBV5_9PEZI|nr:hypothetical protein GP486_007435 [Trichoglossum hirsutum]
MLSASSGLGFIPRLELSYRTALAVISTTCLGPIIALLAFEILSRRSKQLAPKGCRKLGLRVESNLADQYDSKYDDGGPPDSHEWRVKSLWIYPVKSCKGIEMNRGSVLNTGMQYDRQFSFAQLKSHVPVSRELPELEKKSEQKWEFITQRQFPLLALVRTELWVPDPSSETYSPNSPEVLSEGALIIKFPYARNGWRGVFSKLVAALTGRKSESSFTVPLNPSPDVITRKGYTVDTMKIWMDSPMGLNMSVDSPTELRDFLGVRNPLALFRVVPGKERDVFKCAPRREELGWQPVIGFSDSTDKDKKYALHIINLASVRDVGKKVAREIPKFSALRFRPNIIMGEIRVGDTIQVDERGDHYFLGK